MIEPSPSVRPSIRDGYEYHLAAITDGQWCPDCLLPSALVARLIFVNRADPTRWLGVALHHRCLECDWQQYAPGPL